MGYANPDQPRRPQGPGTCEDTAAVRALSSDTLYPNPDRYAYVHCDSTATLAAIAFPPPMIAASTSSETTIMLRVMYLLILIRHRRPDGASFPFPGFGDRVQGVAHHRL